MARADFMGLDDAKLLAQCEVDTYRASGPGGQKRNKTSSAVRLRHAPSGLLVIAEESRSQHENKAKALVRLRHEFALELREAVPDALATPEGVAAWAAERQIRLDDWPSPRTPAFWELAALVLDLFDAHEARVSEVAERLAVSTGRLIDLLRADDALWQRANRARLQYGQKPLKPT